MNDSVAEFKHSLPLTLGVELELQLVSPRDFDLTRAATDLLGSIDYDGRFGEIKLEITESMKMCIRDSCTPILDEFLGAARGRKW